MDDVRISSDSVGQNLVHKVGGESKAGSKVS